MSCRHIQLNVRTLSLISICSLVLAAVLVWTRLEHAGALSQVYAPGYAESTVSARDDGGVKPAAAITVNSTSDTTNATDGLCTLREAITAANTDTPSGAVAGECSAGSGTDTISFSIPPAAPGCAGGACTITLSGSGLTVNTSLNLQGPGANLLTIAGNNTFRIFSLTSGGAYSVNLSGLTIANGGTTGMTGGGIEISSIATVRITSCVLRNNAATLGGAIANSSGTLTIENSTVSNNTAGTGGGIEIGGPGSVNIINSTIAGNSATTNDGGGLIISGAPVTIVNTTITGNTAASSGGGIMNSGGGSAIAVRNTIAASNTAGTGRDLSGSFSSQGHNLIGSSSGNGGFTNGLNGDLVDVNARLGTLANNGGPMSTVAPLPGSPALDAGDDCVLTNACSPSLSSSITTDQRLSGFLRAADANGDGAATVDIGSYEVQSFVVTNLNDGGPGSLRQAVADANAKPGADAVNFQGGLAGTIPLLGSLQDLTSMFINGPGANTLTVMRSSSPVSTFRIFTVPSGQVVGITGLTLSNGNQTSGLAPLNSGGAVANSGTLTLNGMTFSGNSAINGGGALFNNGTLTLVNSTVTGNSANTWGGGIYNVVGTTNIINSTISGNSTPGEGGGIFSFNATINLTNVTITNNRCDSDNAGSEVGGGISLGGGGAVFRNTIVSGNFRGTGSVASDVRKGSAVVSGSSFNLIGTLHIDSLFGPGDLVDGVNNNQVGVNNPKLAILANNGGPTQTHAPLPGSLALDRGSNSLITETTDQRGAGFSRSVDAASDADATATVDVGAFEAQVSVEDIVDKTINEDGSLQFSFTLGGAFTGVTAVSSNTTLVPNNAANIALSGTGGSRTLTINPAADQFGTSTITITVDGPNSQSMTDTFILTVNAVNEAPSFTKGPDVTVNNDVNNHSVFPWAQNISAGPANESSQTLTFQITGNTNPGLFFQGPSIHPGTGALSFGTPGGAGGTATITVALMDNGGTANGGVDTSPPQTFNITVVPLGGFVSFSAASYDTTESSGFTTITVKRSGDLTRAVTVDYASSADNGMPCSAAGGVATPKCDFTTTLGTLAFAAGEDTKTFNVLISQDSFVEGPETFSIALSNPGGFLALAAPSTTSITIADDATEPSTNPIDDVRNFVRQHYHDFLNREPDQAGWDFWTNQISSCGNDAQCNEVRRIDVSASFFLSIEFQQSGYLVERFYKVAYADATGTSTFNGQHQVSVPVVRFIEFLRDTQRIGRGVVVLQPGWEQALENNKQAYALEFVSTGRFVGAFSRTLSPAQFVDRLDQRAGGVLSPSERSAAINLFGGASETTDFTARARAVRMVADDTDLYNAEFNRAFVLAQYFGYLRRNPNDAPDSDYTGYDFWLTKLNQFNGNYINAEMVKAFLSSIEYRQRFGP